MGGRRNSDQELPLASSISGQAAYDDSGQVVHTHVPLTPTVFVTTWSPKIGYLYLTIKCSQQLRSP